MQNIKKYDLLIKNIHIIDPFQEIDSINDIAFKNGKVKEIGKELNVKETKYVLNENKYIIVPGLIDFHVHVYWGGTALGVNADSYCINQGVTTCMDAGSAGAANFNGFKKFIINNSKTRILAFLNISFPGIFGIWKNLDIGEHLDTRLLSIDAAEEVYNKFKKDIVGIKVRASFRNNENASLSPIYIAKEAAKRIKKPMMVHIRQAPPFVYEILSLLREGDILTHCFRYPNSIIDEKGNLIKEIKDAKERGVILDIGHGRGSFSFKVAKRAMEQNIFPDIISTDLHVDSIGEPVCGLITTLSKFLGLGMKLNDVIKSATFNPAHAVGMEKEIGNLRPNSEGDATILELQNKNVTLFDSYGESLEVNRILRYIATISKGKIVNISNKNKLKIIDNSNLEIS